MTHTHAPKPGQHLVLPGLRARVCQLMVIGVSGSVTS